MGYTAEVWCSNDHDLTPSANRLKAELCMKSTHVGPFSIGDAMSSGKVAMDTAATH